MAGRFSGKSAILTGGAKGIGMATALRYLAEDGVLAVVDKEPAGSTFAESLRAAAGASANRLSYVEAELTAESGVAAAIEAVTAAIGAPDILINNVGFGANPRPIEELGLDEWNTFLAINLSTAFLMSRAVVPMMREKGDGRIVNLASIVGLVGNRLFAHIGYQATKGALVNVTRGLAVEWADRGIRVNAVAPTFFRTNFGAAYMQSNPGMVDAIEASTPMGRFGEPWELAGGLLYLASRASSMVTGVTLPIDGGWTAA